MTASESRVLQVTNISPSVTMVQLETLFGFLGPIEEMQVFPKTNTVPVSAKVAFINYQNKSAVETGQHLSNTVFIDKALVCVAYAEGKIPDETTAMQYVAPATSETDDEHQIPGNVDPNKVEEIKRTIYVGNLDSKTATAEQLLKFFSTCGEVRFVRMAGDETQPTRFAFVEFADTTAVQNALQLNGMLFGDRPIKVNHSNNAIVKPQNKTQETTAKEIEEAMRRVREAQSLISKALEPEVKDRKRSRSRSRHRRRKSRSGSRKRRSSSRSRRRRKSRSRSYGRSSRSRRSRSKERRRKRTRSRSRKRSRSKKRERSSSRKKEKSKSRSRSPSKKSSRHKKDRKRDRDRDRDRDSKKRRHRSRSRSGSKDGDKKDKDEDKDKEKKGKDSDKKSEETNSEKKEVASPGKETATNGSHQDVMTNGEDVEMKEEAEKLEAHD